MSTSRLWVATGLNWPDSLVAGPAAAADGAVFMLINGTDPLGSPPTRAWVRDHRSGLTEIVAVGGPTAITSDVLAALTQDALG